MQREKSERCISKSCGQNSTVRENKAQCDSNHLGRHAERNDD